VNREGGKNIRVILDSNSRKILTAILPRAGQTADSGTANPTLLNAWPHECAGGFQCLISY